MDIQQRIAEILAKEAAAIAAVKVTPSFEAAVLALRDCESKVLTTGMGKAGHIAHKFAATLCSTGTPAAFIHPGEAAHGDREAGERDGGEAGRRSAPVDREAGERRPQRPAGREERPVPAHRLAPGLRGDDAARLVDRRRDGGGAEQARDEAQQGEAPR